MEPIKGITATIKLDVTGKIGTPIWHKTRTEGLTSTGAALALDNYIHKNPSEVIFLPEDWTPSPDDPLDFGLSMYGNTPLSLYQEKTDTFYVPEAKSKSETFVLDFGTLLEAPVRDLYEDLTKYHIHKPEAIFQDSEFDFILDEPDGIIETDSGELRCYEGKTTSSRTFKEEWCSGVYGKGGKLPNHYYIQCVQHMRVLGLKHCTAVCCSRDTGELAIVEILHDPDIEMLLIRAEIDFWQNHVLAKNPPVYGGLDADKLTEHKKRIWNRGLKDEKVSLKEEHKALLARYYEEKAAVEIADAESTSANAAILMQQSKLFGCKTAEELEHELEILKSLEDSRKISNTEKKRLENNLAATVSEILDVVGDAANAVLPLSDSLQVEVSNRITKRETLDSEKLKTFMAEKGYPLGNYMKTSVSYSTSVKTKKTDKKKKTK